ncbi:hypothetical protein DM01DRAFT_1325537 [Hesseltinella vesiculosa]|uniref:BHLH domain-containing protein n=1 Tax=Hesseltinella vesiculosa TaxID=101127 RepID=A0A1X2GAP3_9FUNG|nr:hypothetical protein DM01DRAFT_1325537 [Hesseltinella vesiculosa]
MTMDGPLETLSSPNDLITSSQDANDKMILDDLAEEKPTFATIDKPQLPSINNISPYSPIPHTLHGTNTSDEYLRHRMSDMSMTSAGRSLSHRGFSAGGGSKANSPPPMASLSSSSSSYDPVKSNIISPLEPMHYHDVSPTYSRRGSLNTHEYRRPSITEMTSLPFPSATTSRRESVATVVSDYDYQSSRSSSPSPYHPPYPPSHHPPSSFHDAYQRRHSIATVEPSSRMPKQQQRSFRFPATIEESPHGVYSAPSSPPEIMPSANEEQGPASFQRTSRTHSHQGSYTPTSSHRYMTSPSSRQHHPYATLSRRRSILNEDDTTPSLARRASMPVVTTRGHLPTSSRSSRPSDYLHPHGNPMEIDDPATPSPLALPTSTSATMIDPHTGLPHSSMASPPSLKRKPETPYSRSPELRISHKLAERKRRKEMKELFDELRDALPVEKNLKTSKWEILSKAVEFITVLKRRDYEKENEVNTLRHQLDMLKRERGMANGSLHC